MQIQFTDIIVWIAVLAVVWFILTSRGIFSGNKAAKKAVEDKKAAKAQARNRRWMSFVMGMLERFATKVGNGITDTQRTKYDYYIVRLEMNVPFLNRHWKPIEIAGFNRLMTFIGVILFALGVTRFTFNPLWFGAILIPFGKFRELFWEQKVLEEDKEIEQDFHDLYLILCPKLKMGANARIAPTLSEYMQTLEHLHAPTEHLAIKKFVRLLRSTIELYPDEVLALTKIRDYYKAASVVNFCNIAIQAMNGIDNYEKLVAFEQELTRRKLDDMRKRATKLVEKAQKATFLMYVILAEFVILTLYSRIAPSMGSMGSLFG